MPNPTGKNTRPPKPANPEIDAGLDRLAETLPNGATLTNKEIAEAVGCSVGYIRNVYLKAMRKMEREFRSRIAADDLQFYIDAPDSDFSVSIPAAIFSGAQPE